MISHRISPLYDQIAVGELGPSGSDEGDADEGTVIAVGDAVWEQSGYRIDVGRRITFAKGAGSGMELDGERYRLMSCKAVLCIIKEDV